MSAGLARLGDRIAAIELPLADGGDGTLDVLARYLGGTTREFSVRNAVGAVVRARCLWNQRTRVAVIEMAEASGLKRLAAGERDPLRSSTFGTGELIRHALALGAREIVIGVGGSATIDGGAGALAALGAAFVDARGARLAPEPAALDACHAVELAGLDPRLADVSLRVLCDVSVCLSEAGPTFAPQKGVDPGQYAPFATALRALDQALWRQTEKHLLEIPWGGAAGGIAAGLNVALGAALVPGAGTVAEYARLPELVREAHRVITGEGRFDETSKMGKVPGVVCRIAAAHGVPCAIIAGQLAPGATAPGNGELRALCPDPAAGWDPRETPTLIAQAAYELGRAWLET